ncbi:MAG TPA: WecB/TagA/CpsF family glycosyltransferase [Bacteroidota bacterium]|nr:WecB/TagA/CpsF family glycosyltransferase [Bacteroidota bacterium]
MKLFQKIHRRIPVIEGVVHLFGVKLNNVRSSSALWKIRKLIKAKYRMEPGKVFFLNVHSIHLARLRERFKMCLNQADLVLPDGSGLNLAARLFGTPIAENLNGTDFTPKLLKEAERERWSVYLFGASKSNLLECNRRLHQRFPKLQITGFSDGRADAQNTAQIIDDINAKQPDILLVALGSPLQEEWIANNAQRLKVKVCLAVGGLFDFLSGARRRAPLWMRKWGIEWMFRFAQEPGAKWQRVFVEIPSFLWFIAIERIRELRLKPLRFTWRVSA